MEGRPHQLQHNFNYTTDREVWVCSAALTLTYCKEDFIRTYSLIGQDRSRPASSAPGAAHRHSIGSLERHIHCSCEFLRYLLLRVILHKVHYNTQPKSQQEGQIAISPAESHLPQVLSLHPRLETAIREKSLYRPQSAPVFRSDAPGLQILNPESGASTRAITRPQVWDQEVPGEAERHPTIVQCRQSDIRSTSVERLLCSRGHGKLEADSKLPRQ
jgi:hypothetical protein